MGAAGGGSSGSSGPLASGASIGSIGLQTYATLLQSQGTAAADTYQAERLDMAAQYGTLKATQTSDQMTRNLNTTLGNIEAVRAAANTDPNSPTGAAVRDNQEAIGNSQRQIAVGNINAQTEQEKSDAAYYRTAASNALLSGDISAAAGVFKAIGGANFSGIGNGLSSLFSGAGDAASAAVDGAAAVAAV